MDRSTEVTRDFIDALIQLRRLDPAALPAPDALHKQLHRSVERMLARASQAGFSREDVNDIAYAVVALADEIAISRSEEYRAFWAGASLQLRFFQENVAGEGFFARLEALRRDPRRRSVLQIYYLVLLLGFQGRYQVRGGDLELMRLTEDLQRELDKGRRFDDETLSPQGERPDEGRAAARGSRFLLGLGLGTAALIALAWVGLSFWVGHGAAAVASRAAAVRLG